MELLKLQLKIKPVNFPDILYIANWKAHHCEFAVWGITTEWAVSSEHLLQVCVGVTVENQVEIHVMLVNTKAPVRTPALPRDQYPLSAWFNASASSSHTCKWERVKESERDSLQQEHDSKMDRSHSDG